MQKAKKLIEVALPIKEMSPQMNIINAPANRMSFEQKTKGIQFYLPLQEWLAKKE